MVLNFDTYSLSILVTDATYVTFGIINDLTNIIVKCLGIYFGHNKAECKKLNIKKTSFKI
jgi:hypothetical protein